MLKNINLSSLNKEKKTIYFLLATDPLTLILFLIEIEISLVHQYNLYAHYNSNKSSLQTLHFVNFEKWKCRFVCNVANCEISKFRTLAFCNFGALKF